MRREGIPARGSARWPTGRRAAGGRRHRIAGGAGLDHRLHARGATDAARLVARPDLRRQGRPRRDGAAEGAGLGHRFLRHLQRTGVLLHLVDVAPFDENVDPVADAKAIVNELRKYDEALVEKPRWLVLNKVDMIPEEDRKKVIADFVKNFKWKGPVFEISALTGLGCDKLCYALQDYLDSVRKDRDDAEERSQDPRYTDQLQDKTPD